MKKAFCLLCFTGLTTLAADLTTFRWKVTGLDRANNSWNNSDLVFTNQVTTENGFEISGYFDWRLDGVFLGRELFNGTLSTNGELNMAGYQLVDPRGIITASYRSFVTPDGARIINGRWSEGIPGSWSAVAIPSMEIDFLILSHLGVCWQAATNTWYQLQKKNSLTDRDWSGTTTNWIEGTGALCCISNIVQGTQQQGFFRLGVSITKPD